MTLERVPTQQPTDFHPQQKLQLDCLQFRPILRLMAHLGIKGQPFEELVVEGLPPWLILTEKINTSRSDKVLKELIGLVLTEK